MSFQSSADPKGRRPKNPSPSESPRRAQPPGCLIEEGGFLVWDGPVDVDALRSEDGVDFLQDQRDERVRHLSGLDG